MDTTFRGSASRRLALMFFALVAVALATAAAGARSLHLALSRSEPGKDSTVAAPPKELKLYFSENVKAAVTAVKLMGADSTFVELAPLVLGEGKVPPVVASVKGTVKAGKHTVVWRTVGADGHAINGQYNFTVKAAAPGKATGSNR